MAAPEPRSERRTGRRPGPGAARPLPGRGHARARRGRGDGAAQRPGAGHRADGRARGRTSREIAETYVLSVRTVEHHLGRIYRKLGVTGRADLAAVLLA
ncbi:hypothetical protein STANM309S_03943 [Streptomyces tanashiensis]